MANFCTKCGSTLSTGTRFCVACGTPVGQVAPAAPAAAAPVATPTPVAQAPTYAAPAASQPAGQAAARKSSALKMILIIFGVIAGMAVIAVVAIAFVAWRVTRSVHMDRKGGVTISTPQGDMNFGQTPENVTEADTGAPIYPGATPQKGGLSFNTDKGSIKTYAFETTDSPSQVIAFYREKLGTDASIMESQNGGIITIGKSGDNDGVMITIGQQGQDGKTFLTYSHTHRTKPL